MAEATRGPWTNPGRLSGAEARLLPWLTGDERLLWTWDSTRSVGPKKRSMRFVIELVLVVLALTYSVSILMTGHEQLGRARAAATIGLAILAFAILLAKTFGGKTVRTWMTKTWSLAQGGRHPEGGLHGLTQYRVLTLHEGYLAATLLEPGEPVIQYGSLRIDRPARRGSRIIRAIPQAEQHRLFAALKQARALRNGHSAGADETRRETAP